MIEPFGGAQPRVVWSVGGLVQAVGDALAARFPVCTVGGELAGFSRAASGHCYFTLKDADGATALVRCAMFRRAATLLDFIPRDGQLVEVRGRLAVYEARGELQLVVESMRVAGDGALFEQFLRLKARLEAEGLFDPSRKRTLPPYPRRIGIVTSLAAAALHDVVAALARRAPHVSLVVYPALVQGPEAPPTLVDALARAAERREVEVLLLCRGGGSLEDLWAFNDERVVRAVSRSPIPVVCGVGHDTDVTLCDFAADLRAPTPTAAAELCAPATAELLGRLGALGEALRRRLRQRLDEHSQRLDRAALRLCRPQQNLSAQRHRLDAIAQRLAVLSQRDGERRRLRMDALASRLRRAMPVATARAAQRLDSLEARLRSLDPRQVLQRGYAWLEDDQGRAVVSSGALSAGQRVRATLSDGEAAMVVTQVRHTGEPPAG